MVIDKGLNESFHAEYKWMWRNGKKVDIYFFVKRVPIKKHNGSIFFVDYPEKELGDHTISMVTLTHKLSKVDIATVINIISDEYGAGQHSTTPTNPELIIETDTPSYIR